MASIPEFLIITVIHLIPVHYTQDRIVSYKNDDFVYHLIYKSGRNSLSQKYRYKSIEEEIVNKKAYVYWFEKC